MKTAAPEITPEPTETTENTEQINVSLARQQTEYGRAYGTPAGVFPSVTTIINETEKPAAKQRLIEWKAANPDHEKYARRGTLVHDIARRYLIAKHERGIEWGNGVFPMAALLDKNYNPLSPAEAEFCLHGLDSVREFVTPMRETLERFSNMFWVEGPIQDAHQFTIGSDGNPRVWSTQYKYAGCPDLIATHVSGDLALVDIKTSDCAYRKFAPAAKYKDPEYRAEYKAWMKLRKAAMQIAAYIIAVEETLEVCIEKGIIFVATPGESYTYSFDKKQLEYYKTQWLKRVEQYYCENPDRGKNCNTAEEVVRDLIEENTQSTTQRIKNNSGINL